MESKNGLKICEGISCSSYSVKELDVIVHKNHFLISPYSFLAILYPTSLANLVVDLIDYMRPREWNGMEFV